MIYGKGKKCWRYVKTKMWTGKLKAEMRYEHIVRQPLLKTKKNNCQ